MGIWWLFGLGLFIILFDENLGAVVVWGLAAIVLWMSGRQRERIDAMDRQLHQNRVEIAALEARLARVRATPPADAAPTAAASDNASAQAAPTARPDRQMLDERGYPIDVPEDAAPRPADIARGPARFEAREPTQVPPTSTPRPAPAVARAPVDRDALPPPLPPEDVGPRKRVFDPPPLRTQDDAVGRTAGALVRFFTEGNAPVKVGVLLVLAGIGALLKYAVDQDWISFPPTLRLAAIAAAAIAAFVFGWRQRATKPTFSLTLQGGAIGTLYLVVYAALRLYQLISPTTALLLMTLLAGAGLIIAVRQSAQLIAVFASIGGFAAPILASTGSGNYVALFSFYAVLNAFIFAAAWMRAWRALNLVGFVATFGVGLIWGAQYYAPEHFRNVEPFLILFFLFYVGVGFLYALKKPSERGLWVDGTLVFGTPLIAFGLQSALLDGNDLQLAWSALFVAAVHGALALSLLRKEGAETLANSYLLIAGGFATVAVPLALGAKWTQGVWALEGLAFIWLGLTQRSAALRAMGGLLMFAAGIAWLYFYAEHSGVDDATARLTGALLIVGSAWIGTWLLDRERASRLAPILFIFGAIGYAIASLDQIDAHANSEQVHWVALPLALLMLIGAVSKALADFSRMCWLGAAAMAAALPLAAMATVAHDGAMSGNAWAVWIAFFVVALGTLRTLGAIPLAHASWIAALAWLVAHAGYTRAGEDIQLSAAIVMLALPWLIGALLGWRLPHVLAWPMPPENRVQTLATPMVLALGAWLFLSIFSAGQSPTLPTAPIFNPLELMQIAVLFVLWKLSGDLDDPRALRQLLIGVAFVLITAATLRGVHHLADLPWSITLFGDRISQASLSIVWTVLGIGAMIVGARTLRRPLWIAGVTLAGIVVVKLLIVDRQYLGDLPGIVAFLGVGMLLAVVGYYAPAPPNERAQ